LGVRAEGLYAPQHFRGLRIRIRVIVRVRVRVKVIVRV
jgi:hypothetical protein